MGIASHPSGIWFHKLRSALRQVGGPDQEHSKIKPFKAF